MTMLSNWSRIINHLGDYLPPSFRVAVPSKQTRRRLRLLIPTLTKLEETKWCVPLIKFVKVYGGEIISGGVANRRLDLPQRDDDARWWACEGARVDYENGVVRVLGESTPEAGSDCLEHLPLTAPMRACSRASAPILCPSRHTQPTDIGSLLPLTSVVPSDTALRPISRNTGRSTDSSASAPAGDHFLPTPLAQSHDLFFPCLSNRESQACHPSPPPQA